jgi:hypothetical protein
MPWVGASRASIWGTPMAAEYATVARNAVATKTEPRLDMSTGDRET